MPEIFNVTGTSVNRNDAQKWIDLTQQLNGAESFLRISYLLSYLVNVTRFVGLRGSVTRSQQSATDPYLKPYDFSPYIPILFL